MTNPGDVHAVRIADYDPDLLADTIVDPRERSRLWASAVSVPPGRWEPNLLKPDPSLIGLMLLSGLVLRITKVHGHTGAELLGDGDMLRPWQDHESIVPVDVHWRVLRPSVFALLDDAFVRRSQCAEPLMAMVAGRLIWGELCQVGSGDRGA